MRILLLCIFICLSFLSKSQSSNQFGILPSFNLNHKINPDWKLNLKVESRQQLKQGAFYESEPMVYDYLLTDVALLSSKKVGLNNTIAAGYLIRFENSQLVHRSIQQFVMVKKFTSFRLAHRFSADQTFAEDESAEFRFRYRIALELPLNGQSVDSKEFYLKVNHEYLNGFQSNEYDLEIRLIPFIGFQFTSMNKIELGLDDRVDSFIDGSLRRRSWVSFNWYLSL